MCNIIVSMQTTILLRLSSQALSALMGGIAVFCLYYAAQIPDPDVVRYLFLDALKWGGCAAAIVYAQGRYLD
jgi:hypothetical protein